VWWIFIVEVGFVNLDAQEFEIAAGPAATTATVALFVVGAAVVARSIRRQIHRWWWWRRTRVVIECRAFAFGAVIAQTFVSHYIAARAESNRFDVLEISHYPR
jgi:hypothetical protein